MKQLIIKRKGQKEAYDEKKVFASVYAAALNALYKEKKASPLASEIMKAVNKWVKSQVKKKRYLTSSDIRSKIIKSIRDKDVLILYKHHLDLC